jgi:hypothetical protein
MSDPVAEAAAQLAEQNQTPEIPAEAGTTAVGESMIASEHSTPGEQNSHMSISGADYTLQDAAPVVANDAGSVAAGALEKQQETELPNAAPAAVESTTGPASALSAVGDGTTYTTAANSVEPLHVRVAAHLEAIFQMTKEHVEAAPNEATAHAQTVKTHIGDVLHRISNGMAVAEGELVQKLEALFRVL